MESTASHLLLVALAGYAAGWAMPFARWQIERYRALRLDRKHQIARWRAEIAAHFSSEAAPSASFRSSSWYLSLRAHLQSQTLGRFDAFEFGPYNRPRFAAGDEATYEAILLDEVLRIERHWKLI